MKPAGWPWLCSCLLACVVDTSLGDHQAPEHAARPAQADPSRGEPDDAGASSRSPAIGVPHGDAAVRDEAPAGETPPEPTAVDPPPDAAHDAPLEMPAPTGDHPASEDAGNPPAEQPHDPPTTDPPPPSCDVPTDNACLICDQASCCEARRACLEVEGCACRLECRTAEHPADCSAACPEAADRYEPWLQCLRDHCADACAL